MASEIKIRLRQNKRSGKVDIFIGYESEDDWLPYEHERRHRQIVEDLLGQGILNPDDLGKVTVERTVPIDEQEKRADPDSQKQTTAPQRQKASQLG